MAWYLLIIMLVSFSFSMVIYRMTTFELDRIERMQRLRIERQLPESFRITPPNNNVFLRPLDPELVVETKNRLKMLLAFINLAILMISTGGGYFLAGRTLKPIKEMMDEQNQFITDASHELKTPLTSLKTEIEVNLRDKKLTLDGAKKLLKSNLEEVNHLQALSDGLIKLTQYQRGTNGLIFTEISLNSVFNEAVKKVANLARNKKIEIANKVNDLKIQGNKQALVELFVIFLDNSIKYSPQKTKIKLTSKKTDNHVLVYITDQGIGIEEKDLPHLFGRFYQADKARTKSEMTGYGLGLSIAKQIVEKHHGSIKVQSQPKKGTVFTVQLPVNQPHQLIYLKNKVLP
jgi:signal transduction histidine kinase